MSHFLASIFNAVHWRRVIFPAVSSLMLAGCTSGLIHHAVGDKIDENLPQQQVADFLSTDCADIWSLTGEVTDKNPLYWLRGIDCAERLTPEQARTEARMLDNDRWQEAFKRGILLGNAKINPVERRDLVAHMDAQSRQIPTQVRPLFELWRDGQALQLQLSDERSRYAKLQQTSDSELDILRQQQQHLRSQLDLTTRKLENLTDIERQLSTRKPAGNFNPDASHAGDKPPAAKDDVPPEEDKP
ncbi:two-component system QseEF-associated lipoprotein QseG [Trabulsiella odontotermitis]|uniref:Membrane protein n=1 Tax=Trabulsiella odontotermitis TaxID=379893 RepID=A0A0L0GIJ6_9ENTR|nr:two-component system QseEF-associated lipoprotein QseG [Trabulsiella odontotermitis]KNC88965.1 membrane protein [Trabulsiella odontotermitis]